MFYLELMDDDNPEMMRRDTLVAKNISGNLIDTLKAVKMYHHHEN